MGKRIVTAEAVRLRLAGLCARSEQCEADLRMKIRRAGVSPQEEDEIIAFLKRERFLDEERFARAFARDKARFAGWGRMKIRAALAAKRVPAQAIAAALEELDPADGEDALLRTMRSKARGLDLTSRQDLAKLCRHVMGKGFSYDDFSRGLASLRREAKEEEEE